MTIFPGLAKRTGARARRLLVVCLAPVAMVCTARDPSPIDAEWRDDFERGELGDNYRPTAEQYAIVNGALSAGGAYNHPLWLRRKLPDRVAIEFDCWSNSADGDIKVEIVGDGRSHARDRGQYTSSGYVAVMGGWNNSKSILARGNEHGTQVESRVQPKVEKGRKYHWKIVRDRESIRWFVDDMNSEFLSLDDPHSPTESGYFAFNNWASDSWFDNLRISPLEP